MKDFKITYALWLGIAFSMSSCSCCSGTKMPLFTAYDELFFSKYAIGDTVKLKNDSLNLDIVFANISKSEYRGKGGFSKEGCYAYTDKTFNLFIRNYDKKGYDKRASYNLIYRSGKLPDNDPFPTTYNTFLHTNESGGFTFYKSYFIGSKSYKNVLLLNMSDKFQENLVYGVLIDSTGILGAINYYKSLVYK